MRCDLRHDLVEDSDTPTRALIPFRVCRMEVYVYGEGSCAFEVAMFWMPHVLVLFPRIDVVTCNQLSCACHGPALLCRGLPSWLHKLVGLWLPTVLGGAAQDSVADAGDDQAAAGRGLRSLLRAECGSPEPRRVVYEGLADLVQGGLA